MCWAISFDRPLLPLILGLFASVFLPARRVLIASLGAYADFETSLAHVSFIAQSVVF